MKKHPIRNIFITGIVAMLPLILTIYLLKILYNLIVSNLTPLAAKITILYKVNIPESLMGVVTVFIFALFVFLIGLLTRVYVGKLLLSLLDKIVSSIPLANTIYTIVKQMLDSFGSSAGNFRKVVLVQAFGNYCIGFVVRETQPLLGTYIAAPCYNIFVPTAPNPTTGFSFIIPQSQCVDLPIGVDEGVKFVLSVGLLNFTTPEEAKQKVNETLNTSI